MQIQHFHHFNPWALLVCAVLQWILGAVWYSPALFAKPWMAALKIEQKTMDAGMKKSLILGMIASFLGGLVLSFILDHFIIWSHSETIAAGAMVAFISWLGFIAAPSFAQGIYEQRPFRLFAISTGYWLVGLLISGPILAVWQ
jgi:hypothetical protein